MPRNVRHDATGPDVFDADELGDDGKLYVCRCGLSDAGALCGGSHNATADERDDVVYKYAGDDSDGERRIVEETDS